MPATPATADELAPRQSWRWLRAATVGAAVAGGVGAAGYAALVAAAWMRFGRTPAPPDWPDPLLDRFMPEYDIEERHQIRIAAPPAVVFRAACAMDLSRPWLSRAIFRTRELVMGAAPDQVARPTAVIPLVKSIGWGVLAELTDREIVMGAVTQPWVASPAFRAVAPDAFAAFDEPDYVKIAWTLRAEPIDERQSMFLTETRATTTNPYARARFRRYWSLVSPGVVLIRRLSLRPLKEAAEGEARPH